MLQEMRNLFGKMRSICLKMKCRDTWYDNNFQGCARDRCGIVHLDGQVLHIYSSYMQGQVVNEVIPVKKNPTD